MINILLVSNDFEFGRRIINFVSTKYDTVRIYNISVSIEETFKNFKYEENIVDLIILKLSKDEVIKFINEKYKEIRYLNIPIIIVLKENYSDIGEINKNLFIFNNIDELLKEFNTIIKLLKNSEELNKIIYNYLFKIGYNSAHLGTKYLANSIIEIFARKFDSKFKLEKEIYPIVAKKFNTSVHNIKCDITLATKYMNNHCKVKNKQEFFNIFIDEYINTKDIIKCLIFKIRNEYIL